MADLDMRGSSHTTDPERIQLSLHDLSRTRKGLYAPLGEEISQRAGEDLPLRDELSAVYDALERIDAEERSLKMSRAELRRPVRAQPYAAAVRQERQPHTQAPAVQQGGLTTTGTVFIEPPHHEEVTVTPPKSVGVPVGRTYPQRGSPVSDEDRFCTNCGMRMADEETSSTDTADVRVATVPDTADEAEPVRYCIECGKPLEAQNRFCVWCGARLTSQE